MAKGKGSSARVTSAIRRAATSESWELSGLSLTDLGRAYKRANDQYYVSSSRGARDVYRRDRTRKTLQKAYDAKLRERRERLIAAQRGSLNR